jgi:hypothetical protein
MEFSESGLDVLLDGFNRCHTMSRNVVDWRPQPVPPKSPPQVGKLPEKPERRDPLELKISVGESLGVAEMNT